MKSLKLVMAQINPIVGDVAYNTKRINAAIKDAEQRGAGLVVFPELAVTGYPPEDLLHKAHFVDDNINAIDSIAREVGDITAIVGFVDRPVKARTDIYNACAIMRNGKITDIYHKMHLPNYGVFDEERYFKAGSAPLCLEIKGVRVGITICEDIWRDNGPVRAEADSGAQLIININASPYQMGKAAVRDELISTRARENGVLVAYVNMVGAQDELVFDGRSMIADAKGEIIVRSASFTEDISAVDIDINRRSHPATPPPTKPMPLMEEVLMALQLGTKDYISKNGFSSVIIALSGGIDSALVLAIAAMAIGADKITALYMPSRYSSKESLQDARSISKNLGVELLVIDIDDIFGAYLQLLKDPFKDTAQGVAEENLQARIRGNIIMALSNKFNHLVLTTGNKSEMSVGYATLYGDMAGGFAIIKDVPKTLVFKLSRFINERAGTSLIPERIITKAPSAELRADQKDIDSLPPYDQLDPILKAYIEDDKSIDEIIKDGSERHDVTRLVNMVDKSEYKRRQAPPGIKITSRAFGRDRRMPITNGYRDDMEK